MTTPRIAQLSLVAPILADPPPVRVAQAALITVLQQQPPPIHIAQVAMITVIGNAKGFVAMGRAIGLQCWQPCTAFGTSGRIYYVNG